MRRNWRRYLLAVLITVGTLGLAADAQAFGHHRRGGCGGYGGYGGGYGGYGYGGYGYAGYGYAGYGYGGYGYSGFGYGPYAGYSYGPSFGGYYGGFAPVYGGYSSSVPSYSVPTYNPYTYAGGFSNSGAYGALAPAITSGTTIAPAVSGAATTTANGSAPLGTANANTGSTDRTASRSNAVSGAPAATITPNQNPASSGGSNATAPNAVTPNAITPATGSLLRNAETEGNASAPVLQPTSEVPAAAGTPTTGRPSPTLETEGNPDAPTLRPTNPPTSGEQAAP